MPKASPKPLCPTTLRWVARNLVIDAGLREAIANDPGHASAEEVDQLNAIAKFCRLRARTIQKAARDVVRIDRAAKRKGRGRS